VGGRSRHRAAAGRPQPGEGSAHEPARQRRRELALARHARNALFARVRIPARADARLWPFGRRAGYEVATGCPVLRTAFDEFTQALRRRLESDPRVLGLVALGSMSGELPEPDEWSDHDFFVVTRQGEQERMRNELSWLPRAQEIVLAFRETAHGVKALYRDAHLLEFAVFDPDELGLARVNRYRVLFDRADIESRMSALRERIAR